MLGQRIISGPLRQVAARRIPTQVAKRYESTLNEGGFKLQDNAFNRERNANKAHAGESAGM